MKKLFNFQVDEDDLILFGKVEFIRALISYEGESAAEIKKAFEEEIDDYLFMCEKENIAPEKPFKGTFNVRVGEALHEKAVIAASGRGIKLNGALLRKVPNFPAHTYSPLPV